MHHGGILMAQWFQATCRDCEWQGRPSPAARAGATMHELIYPHHRVIVRKIKEKAK